MKLSRRVAIGLTVLLPAYAAPTRAQTFPDHPIKIIVPNPPGGGFDLSARVIAEPFSRALGQPVVIENKAGSGTLVGSGSAARSAPDGYTLLLGGTSNMSLNIGLYEKLPYDPIKDFKPIGLIVAWPFMLVARKELPQQTLAEIIESARENPGRVNFATGGVGTGQYVAAALLARSAGIKINMVPYGSAQAAYPDLIGGRVDLFFDNASTALPQVRGGAVRAYAVSSAKRYPVMPDLPTVQETGLAQLDMETWFGLFAPTGTPEPILARLRAALRTARADPEVAKIFGASGGAINTLSVDETDAFVKREAERWNALLREAGITAQ
jgi:tripartite-type tricarboxylate transporter receptor subunit TctC